MNYTKNYYKTGDDGFLYHVAGGKERRVTSKKEVDEYIKRHAPNGRTRYPLLRELRKDEGHCAHCGRIFRRKSNSQKYCPVCRESAYAETRRKYYLNIRAKHRQKLTESVKELTEVTNNSQQYSMTSRLGTASDLGTFDEHMLDKKYDPSQWDE